MNAICDPSGDHRGETLRVSDSVSWMIRSPAIGAL